MDVLSITEALKRGLKVSLLSLDKYKPHSCHFHPYYKGINKTKRDCEDCNKFYLFNHKKNKK